MRLLDAVSREDAERQVLEMLFIAQFSPDRLASDDAPDLTTGVSSSHNHSLAHVPAML